MQGTPYIDSSSIPRPGLRPGGSGGPGPLRALAGYAVLTVVLTWPLAIRLGDHLPMGDNDLWQNLWNFWWWKTALWERGASPYATDLLFYPDTTSLAFHTHSEANIIITLPVLLAAGEVAALNLATLLGFLLAGWGAYLLVRELMGCCRAAFLAGIIFAFFPQHFEQSLEHLNLASFGAVALSLWAMVRAVRAGGVGRWAMASSCFALNALFSWHNAVLILPGALIIFAHELWRARRSRRAILVESALAGLCSALLLLPWAWPMLREILAGEAHYLKPPPPVRKPIDLLFLVVPAAHHTIWGPLVEPLYGKYRSYASAGFTGYLGLASIVLASLGLAGARSLRRRAGAATEEASSSEILRFRAAPWAALFLFYLLLSLGDELRVAGSDTGLRLPYALAEAVPVLRTIRIPHRFLVPAMLALAVLAARGAAALLDRARRPGAAALGLALLIILDFLWIPYPLREVERPRWVDQVAGAPAGALLNVPGGYRARASQDMYLQTYHGRPLIGGYVSCTPPRIEQRVAEYPFLRAIFEGRPREEIALEPEAIRVLDELPIGVVAVHLERTRERLEELRRIHRGRPEERLYNPEKGIPAAQLEAVREIIRSRWGEPYYRDGEVELYRRPDA
ncbi:MAG: glycosyltransferase family 39 protein [Planctomycetes bacterium]|nr:glycosyltransferase family 39 protein [Planctomycetota bacterium]